MSPFGFGDRTFSLLQCALPAVEVSFLLHIRLIPPVDAANASNCPLFIFKSTSLRNKAANEYFFLLKEPFCWIFSRSLLTGLVIRKSWAITDGKGLVGSKSSLSEAGPLARIKVCASRGGDWGFHCWLISWLWKPLRKGL